MRNVLPLLLLLAGCIPAMTQQKKAIFVIVDGISADVIERLPTPHLDAISKEGGYTRAHVGGEKDGYSQTPTISAVGYNSLLTGTWVNKHDVWDNSIDTKSPNYNYWTIFRLFKEQYPNKKTAIFSSWLLNRTHLLGDGLAATGNFKVDYHFDGLENDTLNYPHDKKRDYMHRIDEAVTDHAAAYIKKEAPDLSWVYLEYTDDMGHMYGDGDEYYRAVHLMDAQIGRLWEAIQYRRQQFKEDWVIYITTDHGRDATTGKNHGGQSERERTTWITTNAKDLNSYFKTGNPGVVDIMPTLARFLNVGIPTSQLREIDGVSLTGPLSATHPGATREGDRLRITWKAHARKGKARIWLTETNHFREGGKDEYKLVKTVPVSRQETVVELGDRPSPFYKIVIEMPDNSLNRWIISPEDYPQPR